MRTVQTGPLVGLFGQVVVLTALAASSGLSGLGWLVGLSCGLVMNMTLTRGLVRRGSQALGPADWVTMTRATLVGGVAALVIDSFSRPTPVTVLTGLAGVALALDAIDGWVARRTNTVTTLGARFDMEVDAFLIFVLSGYLVPSIGYWVLSIGVARYVFVAVGWVLPWLRRPLPLRYWRKVVAATAGIVLTCAAARSLPQFWTEVALALSLALLAESFGRDVKWSWHRRNDVPAQIDAEPVLLSGLAQHG